MSGTVEASKAEESSDTEGLTDSVGSKEDEALRKRLKDGDAILEELFGKLKGVEAKERRRVVRLVLAEKGQRLVVSFAGNTSQFAAPDELLEYDDTHVLLIRDPLRCFCLAGIPHFGETYEATVASVLRVAKKLGSLPIFCFGASAGGYPALRYAIDLRAQGVLGMSAPTTLDLGNDPHGTSSKYPQLANLYRRARHMAIDLVPLYKTTRPRPRVLLLYSVRHERDAWLAERMADLAGVTLENAPDEAGHRVLLHLSKAGQVDRYFQQLFALKSLK